MQPIRMKDILDKTTYENGRPDYRRRIMVLKNKRRVPLGNHATVHFESRETMLYQIHEMLRAEDSWTRPGAIEDELEAYNPIVPGDGELSATLMLEWDTPEERALHLAALVGLEDHVWLEIGEEAPIKAVFDHAQMGVERVSSVQYIRWSLSERQRDAMAGDGTTLRISVDHPHYRARSVLAEETRRELLADLG
jgi:hypothetical protein